MLDLHRAPAGRQVAGLRLAPRGSARMNSCSAPTRGKTAASAVEILPAAHSRLIPEPAVDDNSHFICPRGYPKRKRYVNQFAAKQVRRSPHEPGTRPAGAAANRHPGRTGSPRSPLPRAGRPILAKTAGASSSTSQRTNVPCRARTRSRRAFASSRPRRPSSTGFRRRMPRRARGASLTSQIFGLEPVAGACHFAPFEPSGDEQGLVAARQHLVRGLRPAPPVDHRPGNDRPRLVELPEGHAATRCRDCPSPPRRSRHASMPACSPAAWVR